MLLTASRIFKHHVIHRNFLSYYLFEKYRYRRYRRLTPDEFFKTAAGETISVNSVVEKLERDGIVAISEYYSAKWADDLHDQLIAANEDVRSGKIPADPEGDLLSGKLTWSVPLKNQGIIRIHNVDKRFPLARQFHDDPIFKKIGELYLGAEILNKVTISQYNEPVAGGCRGYHIDSHHNQFKAFVYLNDVNDDNGPHDFLPGSHALTWGNMRRSHRAFVRRNTSISDEEAAATNYKPIQMRGKRGTVLLVDTRGIHQGANLKSGHRIVLTNYYGLISDKKVY